MKRVFIVHGWGGKPDEGWLGWIKKELSKNGFKVWAEVMPEPDYPKMQDWVSFLKKAVGTPDKHTYFIGHSIGCQTILRYLESLSDDAKIGGVVFVAGWLTLKGLETKEEKTVAAPWLKTPIMFSLIKPKLGKTVALFSDNDPFVPIEDSRAFKEKLGAKIIIERGKGHYIESETKEIPALLREILEMAGNR